MDEVYLQVIIIWPHWWLINIGSCKDLVKSGKNRKHRNGNPVLRRCMGSIGHSDLNTLHNELTLQWRHNEHDSVSNHQLHHCLFNCLFRRRSKNTSKICVTGLCAGNSPVTGEIPAQRASNAENVSIWWRHHELRFYTSSHITNYFPLYSQVIFIINMGDHIMKRHTHLSMQAFPVINQDTSRPGIGLDTLYNWTYLEHDQHLHYHQYIYDSRKFLYMSSINCVTEFDALPTMFIQHLPWHYLFQQI